MRNSVAIIRSLGMRGLEVTGAESTRWATGFFSKYCKKRVVYPSPSKYPDRFIEFMLNLLESDSYQIIFPVTDSTMVPIAKHKEEFSKHTLVPLPNYEILIKGLDKAETVRIAQGNGIPCPKTWLINNIEEVETIRNEIHFPIVIKPRRSSGSRGFTLCESLEALLSKYPKLAIVYGPCLIQEYIPPGGEELGVYMLLNSSSELRAVTVQRRLRSYPISGGPSTLRETVDKPELVSLALRLLQAIGFSGVAMVEFKIDPRDKQPKLMEINPRWWGSLQLSILSGVDFPYLLYRLITEGDIQPILTYKTGIRCRWLLPGDFLWFFSAPHKLRNLPTFLKYERHFDIISLRDPGPVIGFFLASMRFAFDRDMWKFIIRTPI